MIELTSGFQKLKPKRTLVHHAFSHIVGILDLGHDSRKKYFDRVTTKGDFNSLPLPFDHCCPNSGLAG